MVGHPSAALGVSRIRSERITVFLVPDEMEDLVGFAPTVVLRLRIKSPVCSATTVTDPCESGASCGSCTRLAWVEARCLGWSANDAKVESWAEFASAIDAFAERRLSTLASRTCEKLCSKYLHGRLRPVRA